MKMQPHAGFTLIELMIVVAIIAILAAIAYPSYRQYVLRSDRNAAKTALLENAQFLERNFTASNRYNQDSAGNSIDTASLPVQQAPKEGIAKYNITLDEDDVDEGTFILKAVPIADDACGTFTLNQIGQKGVTDADMTPAECWNR